MTNTYTEVNLDVIKNFKARRNDSVVLKLLDGTNIYLAIVEVIPEYKRDFNMNSVLLDSLVIHDYFDRFSILT